MPASMIYVVLGSTGEYSDHWEWPVKAYFSKDTAKQHVLDASRRVRELTAQYHGCLKIPEGANEFDPGMQADYNGVRYKLWEVELGDAP